MEFLTRKHTAFIEAFGRNDPMLVTPLRSCFEVLALAAAIDRDCARRLAVYDLSEGRFVLLFLLDRAEHTGQGLAPHVLAERAGVTRATVTGLLDGLERDALVRRIPSRVDRRSITVALTKKGAGLTARLFREHAAWVASLLEGLSVDERDALSLLLGKIWRNTDAGRAQITQDPPADGTAQESAEAKAETKQQFFLPFGP